MPRRAAPGRRDALEAALSDDELRVLLAACERHDVRDWTLVPALAATFTQFAALRLAERYARAGMGPDAALTRAAHELDIPDSTVRTRATRWSEDSRAGCSIHYARDGYHGSAVRLIEDIVDDQETAE